MARCKNLVVVIKDRDFEWKRDPTNRDGINDHGRGCCSKCCIGNCWGSCCVKVDPIEEKWIMTEVQREERFYATAGGFHEVVYNREFAGWLEMEFKDARAGIVRRPGRNWDFLTGMTMKVRAE